MMFFGFFRYMMLFGFLPEILIFCIPCIISSALADCGNKTSEGGLRCCVNFYEVDGECKECPVGRYGVDCSQNCVDGFYGKLCKEECNCTSEYACHSQYGCITKTTEFNKTLSKVNEGDIYWSLFPSMNPLQVIGVFSLGVLTTVFIVSLVGLYKYCRARKDARKEDNQRYFSGFRESSGQRYIIGVPSTSEITRTRSQCNQRNDVNAYSTISRRATYDTLTFSRSERHSVKSAHSCKRTEAGKRGKEQEVNEANSNTTQCEQSSRNVSGCPDINRHDLLYTNENKNVSSEIAMNVLDESLNRAASFNERRSDENKDYMTANKHTCANPKYCITDGNNGYSEITVPKEF